MHIQPVISLQTLPPLQDPTRKPVREQKYLTAMLKLKIRLLTSPPHQDRFMLDAFRLRLLPVTCDAWLNNQI